MTPQSDDIGDIHARKDEREVMRLSAEDQTVFLAALFEPPRPNGALKKAARRHDEQTNESK